MLLARPLLIGKGLYFFLKPLPMMVKVFLLSLFLLGEQQKELSK
jgi:hypothetical protein